MAFLVEGEPGPKSGCEIVFHAPLLLHIPTWTAPTGKLKEVKYVGELLLIKQFCLGFAWMYRMLGT